tara:strand:- start:274 stop:735 length:462 start_codon:yes stop_codon:yes gene_type:complete
MKKFSYYIKWKDAKGKAQVKTYAGVAGRNYWKNKIIKELGEKCIIDEGKELVTESGASQKFSETEKEPLLGPIDQYHSRLNDFPTGRFVMSNWNQKKKVYQSRMYGGLNNYLKVIEPDGAISLQGPDIIKSTDKKNIRTLTDGRRFDCAGWPV